MSTYFRYFDGRWLERIVDEDRLERKQPVNLHKYHSRHQSVNENTLDKMQWKDSAPLQEKIMWNSYVPVQHTGACPRVPRGDYRELWFKEQFKEVVQIDYRNRNFKETETLEPEHTWSVDEFGHRTDDPNYYAKRVVSQDIKRLEDDLRRQRRAVQFEEYTRDEARKADEEPRNFYEVTCPSCANINSSHISQPVSSKCSKCGTIMRSFTIDRVLKPRGFT